MRIVDYETFIRMPSGTIFAPWTPCTTLEEPEIKVDHGWEYKGNLLKKIDTSEIEKEVGGLLDRLNNGEEIPMRQTLHAALSAQTRKAEYYMAEDGNIYLKTA